MTSVAIEIVGNDKGVQAMLEALDIALSPMALAGFLQGVVDPYLRQQAEARFRTEGDSASGAWAPLAPPTQDIRSHLGYGAAHPINVRTGELERFVTQQEANVTMHPWGANLTHPSPSPGGELYDKFEHAQIGGFGTSGKPFPARPVLAMDGVDLAFVMVSLSQHIENTGRVVI